MINVIHLAHVADVIAEATGNDDYDAVADMAADVLRRCPELAVVLERWAKGTAQAADISAVTVAVAAGSPGDGYARWIADAIGTEHPAVLTLVETLMRDGNGGVLDDLAAAQFREAARDALAVARDMRETGDLEWYCGSLLLGVPAALPGDVPA